MGSAITTVISPRKSGAILKNGSILEEKLESSACMEDSANNSVHMMQDIIKRKESNVKFLDSFKLEPIDDNLGREDSTNQETDISSSEPRGAGTMYRNASNLSTGISPHILEHISPPAHLAKRPSQASVSLIVGGTQGTRSKSFCITPEDYSMKTFESPSKMKRQMSRESTAIQMKFHQSINSQLAIKRAQSHATMLEDCPDFVSTFQYIPAEPRSYVGDSIINYKEEIEEIIMNR